MIRGKRGGSVKVVGGKVQFRFPGQKRTEQPVEVGMPRVRELAIYGGVYGTGGTFELRCHNNSFLAWKLGKRPILVSTLSILRELE